jgi:hypothetical protein
MDPTPFVRAVRHVRGESRLSADETGPVLADYVTGIERLEKYLDRYPSTG